LKQFSPRHPNAAKALTNWSRKANYLSGENYKYQTYIGALDRALEKKAEIDAEKEARDRELLRDEQDGQNMDHLEQPPPPPPQVDVDPLHGDLDRE
jgi:hypothetical protein